MPGISQRRFYSTIRTPSAEALDLVAPHSDVILLAWQSEIRSLGLNPGDLIEGGAPDFARMAELLRQSTYAQFIQNVQGFGEQLAGRGIDLRNSLAALNRLFECCIAQLNGQSLKRATPVLALARLHALVGLLILSGYTGQWAAGKKNLVEASLLETEYRRQGSSAYVTEIYEQERRRLSHDLHDEIGHDLILLKLHLEMIEMDPETRDTEQLHFRVTQGIALVSNAIDSVRRLILDLGPAVFEDLGFLPAVRSYISQFSSHTKIEVTLQEGHLPEDIPSTHQVALYRLLQGALSNVLKHASAKKVKVSIGSMKGSMLIMVIEDDGLGFDVLARPKRHTFGLTAMRERIEVLGGKIHLQSKPAAPAAKTHGTRIEVDLPLPGGGQP